VRQHGRVHPDDHRHLPFFVYGTLRPGEANHGPTLRGRAASHTPAVLLGALLYDGPGYPYVVSAPEGEVHGELLHPFPELYEAVLADLDRLEEYVPGAAGNLYERVAREVRGPAGPAVLAWVYVAGEAIERALRASGRRITSGDWKRR
jgi:gamma-glutamylcyclotransferase (GGCT)/AIG2-like uncharacterized protein YtfP